LSKALLARSPIRKPWQPWRRAGRLMDGLPGLMTAAKPSRLISALHQRDHHPGLSIASMPEPPRRWPQLRQAVQPAGGSDYCSGMEPGTPS